jgi:hypothetical protein
MANLNLSEFGEKLFVADADHTFIWDTVGAISKRVSRNSWLNSGTLTSDAPVTISQTWNNAAVAFTGLKVNAAGTSAANSAAASLLLDLQVGGVSKFNVYKDGTVTIGAGIIKDWGSGQLGIGAGGSVLYVSSAAVSCTNQFAIGASFGIPTVFIARDADNTLALRNGANAQTFNVYGTYTSGASYARLAIACDTSGNATLTTQSTGVAGTVSINGVPVGLGKGNVSSNVAVGTGALNANTTGSNNSVLGFQVFQNNTSGSYNVATGWQALYANTTGSVNSAFGAGALTSNTTGQYNSAIGVNALQNNTTGGYNAASGPQALQNNTTGGYNAAIGYNAGTYLTKGSSANATGTNSLFLGTETKAAAAGETNQIVIGYNATGIGSNSVVLGNDSITKTALKGNVGIGTTSPSSKLHVNGAIIQKPDTSATPATNGDLVVEATSNTLLTFKLKGTDGTVRTGTIALV